MKLKFLIRGLFALAVLFVTIDAGLYAQQDGSRNKGKESRESRTPEEIAERKAIKLKEKLSLSDEQYKEVYSLYLENVTNRKSQKESMKNLDKGQRDEMRKKHREEMKTKMQGILTKEQMEQWEKMKSERKGKKGKGNKNKDAPNSPAEK